MARATITQWVQRCPTCGYCSSSIDNGPKIARQVVRSPEYAAQLDHPDFPPLADQFLCWALIQTAAGNDAIAGRAALDAAWACDDHAELAPAADRCRRKAIASFTRAQAKDQRFARDQASEALVLADLHRRTGQFDKVEAICVEGAGKNPADVIRTAFEAERKLAQHGDRTVHTLNEASQIVAP
jgi:hypothetical protein